MNDIRYLDQAVGYTKQPRDKCPERVMGSFRNSVTVFTVAKKGTLTKVGFADEVTCQGDKPTMAVVPHAPRVLIRFRFTGNRAWNQYVLYED